MFEITISANIRYKDGDNLRKKKVVNVVKIDCDILKNFSKLFYQAAGHYNILFEKEVNDIFFNQEIEYIDVKKTMLVDGILETHSLKIVRKELV